MALAVAAGWDWASAPAVGSGPENSPVVHLVLAGECPDGPVRYPAASLVLLVVLGPAVLESAVLDLPF